MKMRHVGLFLLPVLSVLPLLPLLRPSAAPSDPSVPLHPPETRWCFRTEEQLRILPHETLTYRSDTLPPGERRLLVQGHDGTALQKELVKERNGAVVERELLYQTLLSSPRDTVYLIGAEGECGAQPGNREYLSQGRTIYTQGGTLVTPTGQALTYTGILRVIATAYTARPGAITATGSLAREGAIAVDPKVIPYGTAMYIVSEDGEYLYGHATAEDCGAFRGHQIDLYFDTEDACWRFGARYCTVYILG